MNSVATPTFAPNDAQNKPKEVQNEKFEDCLSNMPQKDIHGHAVHLDIDLDKGVFVRSTQLDTLLNRVTTYAGYKFGLTKI